MQYTVSFEQTVKIKIHVTVDTEDAIEAMVRASTIAVDCEPSIAVERTEDSYGLGDAEFDINFYPFKWQLADDWLEENVSKEICGEK